MTPRGVAIIGTSWGARAQLPAFRAAGLEVVALAGRQLEKTRQIARQLGVPYATSNWRSLLERDDVALVSVVTPPLLHCEMARAALEAGKHVLCEKPMALTGDDAEQMLAAARARPTQLALVDHELRFLPVFQRARRLLAEGLIGQLRRAEIRAVNNLWTGRSLPWHWWHDVTQGGGVLGTLCTHQIDLLHYLLDDRVVATQGFLSTFITERPLRPPGPEGAGDTRMRDTTADDFATFHLRYARGGVAVVIASMVACIDEPHSVTLYGDAGTLNVVQGRLLHTATDGATHEMTPPETIEPSPLFNGPYGDYIRATVYFGQALRAALAGNAAELRAAATFGDGLRVLRVIEAVRRSSSGDGSWVQVV